MFNKWFGRPGFIEEIPLITPKLYKTESYFISVACEDKHIRGDITMSLSKIKAEGNSFEICTKCGKPGKYAIVKKIVNSFFPKEGWGNDQDTYSFEFVRFVDENDLCPSMKKA